MTWLQRDRQRAAVARALRRKEWRENGAAIIAGLALFLTLPTVCAVVYAIVDPHHEVVGYLATAALVIAGWLYAAVLGAQMVCRDFGRREGHFLLSRPVTAAQVIGAKARVGFAHIAGLLALVWLWELVVVLLPHTGLRAEHPWTLNLTVALAAACLCAFFLAFAAAALTRHTLSAVMLAVLISVVVVAGPLMTSSFTRWMASPRWPWNYWDAELARSSGVAYLEVQRRAEWLTSAVKIGAGCGVSLLSAALAYVLAVLAARRTNVPKLGTKAMAWAVALVMLLLFTAAMHEVGSNLPVSSTFWFSSPHTDTTSSIVLGKDRLAWIWHSNPAVDELAQFDITTTGAVVQRRVLSFPPPTTSALAIGPTAYVPNFRSPDSPSAINLALFPAPAVYVFDEQSQLFVISTTRGSEESPNTLYAGKPVIKRCLLWRIDWDTGQVAVVGEVPFPEGVRADDDAVAYDARFENGRMYVLFLRGPNLIEPRETQPAHSVLGVYVLGQTTPELERSRDLESVRYPSPFCSPRFARSADGRLYVRNNWIGWWGGVIDPTAPGLSVSGFPIIATGAQAGWSHADGIVVGPGISAQDRSAGLAVLASTHLPKEGESIQAVHTQEISRVTPSLWLLLWVSPWLSHRDPITFDLTSFRRGQIWEIVGANRALGFDVSDPAHPRQFAQVVSYPIQRAAGNGDVLILDHGFGFSVIRVPHAAR